MLRLAAYLDGALDPQSQAELRAHVLTCATCAARLERLRADARRITTTLSSGGATPDVRAAVRARLRRRTPGAWLARGAMFAGALAALLLFAVLIAVRSGATLGRIPDQLFVTDRRGGQVVMLNASDGARLTSAPVGGAPTNIVYDEWRDRLYVMADQSIVALDAQTLAQIARWDSPERLNTGSGMALDAEHGRLYIAQMNGVVALAIDRGTIAPEHSYPVGAAPGPLGVTPDGRTLVVLDVNQSTLRTIDIASGSEEATPLAGPQSAFGGLAIGADGGSRYVMLRGSAPATAPDLWRVDAGGQVSGPVTLGMSPPAWDLVPLDAGRLAIARGDGVRGGVEIVSAESLGTLSRLEPSYDEHHLAVGPGGALFGMNYTRRTVTRFDADRQVVVWRTPENSTWEPWEAVFVRGGWRWRW
jgi:DNA-binding beta-propeller fold protein YncE